MSQENSVWLNQFTLQSKAAWHTRPDLQEIFGTVYDGPIPVEDVATRLFNWEAVEGTVSSTAKDGSFTIEADDRKTMMRPPGALGKDDEGGILGVFKSGYRGHDYKKWLLDNVALLLDDGELSIFSAGLLRQGAQAWVQVSIPDTIETPEGVEFRPYLLNVTSFDGSLATNRKRTIGEAVCDNTVSAALGESGASYRVKHSQNSDLRIMEGREALELVYATADAFSSRVAELSATKMTKPQWNRFKDELAPLKTPQGDAKEGRALTSAMKTRDQYDALWNDDPRVSPWKGTAYGAIQAVNTHVTHEQIVRGKSRDERNTEMAVRGAFDYLDTQTVGTLQKIGVLAA